MKQTLDPRLEKARELTGRYASIPDSGPNGAFMIRTNNGVPFTIIASDGLGWEHVSVSITNGKRCPTWEEMCFIKDLFWEKNEVVIQYHPAEEDYVNMHPYVLHLWKPIGVELPTPNPLMVGLKKKVKRH
jgi:hypothetical protein